MDRRRFIENLLKASGFGALGLSGLPESVLTDMLLKQRFGLDAFENLKRVPSHNWIPTVALAQGGGQRPCVVTIKVMNMIHSPLLYRFSPDRNESESIDAWATRFKLARDPADATKWDGDLSFYKVLKELIGNGLDHPSTSTRLADLHFNDWFGSILNSGRAEDDSLIGVGEADIGPFPGNVAIQSAFHLNQNNTGRNHSFVNTALLEGNSDGFGGDLAYHLHRQKIIDSPLGIACLNMGTTVETTDADKTLPNHILAHDLEQVVGIGRSATDYAKLLRDAVSAGFVDNGLVKSFDRLSPFSSSLRDDIFANATSLREQILSLKNIGLLADFENEMEGPYSNQQAFGKGGAQTAHMDFVAQCLMVKSLLALPDKPIRNFSLLCNVYDLDSAGLTTTIAQSGSQPLTYIEGMRQLGVGLNVLAKLISEHRDLYVVVVSEGGRPLNLGDGDISNGMLLGPKGPNDLKDYSYFNQCALTASGTGCSVNRDPVLDDVNRHLRAYDGGELRNNSGLVNLKDKPNVASFLLGIVQYLESKYKGTRSIGGLGQYIDIQRGSS